MGAPHLASDARFATALARSQHHEALDQRIAAWTSTLALTDLERILAAHEVPATRIFTMADIFADPHYRERAAIVAAADDELESVAMANVVPRLSSTPGAIVHSGHRVGQDTRRVLRDLLGYTDEHLDELKRAGVIAVDGEHAPSSTLDSRKAGAA
jgi:crotonobetainyl-CoA:carnitine CoA-transferase CaiB-like acyl-CoA transferase